MLLQHGSRCLGTISSRCRHAPQLLRSPALTSAAARSSSFSTRAVDGPLEAVTVPQQQDTTTTSSSSPEASSSDSDSSQQEQQQEFPELRLQLPSPTNTQVKTAEFVKSSVDVKDCPPPKLPEFAVIGRSNVGKSSLINLLTNRKSLAMVSKQPGKTCCINHFIINNSWYLVDLPGYGYARTGKDARKGFEQFTRQYFKQRTTLAMVLLLVDCSIPPQDVDVEYAAWLGQQGLPFSIVFTKADKRKKGEAKHTVNIAAFKRALMAQQGFALVPPCLVTSASSGAGKQEVLNFVASLRVMFEQHQKQAKQQKRVKQQQPDDDAGS